MTKRLLTIAFFMLCTTAFAGQIIVSDEHPGIQTGFSPDNNYNAAKVTFTLDTLSAIMITSGGYWSMTMTGNWIVIDDDSIEITTLYENCARCYLITLPKGNHIIKLNGNTRPGDNNKLVDIYLQVLIFTPDNIQAVMETPNTNDPIKPKSIIAIGTLVHVDNCLGVYDLSGKKVYCQINNGDISINTLSSGTYFARKIDGTTTKIVKTY